MEVFRAPRVSLIARPEFLEPEHLRVQWQGSASAGERLAEFAGRICYMSQHNPANRSTADYLENIKKQGHGSVLEHAVYVLLIEGISRSCSHELVRHRAGFGYSQISQRYVSQGLKDVEQSRLATSSNKNVLRFCSTSLLDGFVRRLSLAYLTLVSYSDFRMRIGLAYNEKPDATPASDAYAEWDDPSTIDAVDQALSLFGNVVRLEADEFLPQKLALARPDIVFNMAEGLHGPCRESHVPALCEYLQIPYTGSDPLTLALTLHKGRTKEILAYRGVPTAPFRVIEALDDLERLPLPYPLFVKPVAEGSGKGVFVNNLCESAAQLAERVPFLLERYQQAVLVETYLPGPEFTVAILGNNGDVRCLPIVAFDFATLPAGAPPVYGYEAKWIWDTREHPLAIFQCPPTGVAESLCRETERVALDAYRALGCRDWCRIDVRVDRFGVPNVVELNPLPGIIPDPAMNSCLPKAARVAGYNYDELIQEVLRIAWRRLTGHTLPVAAAAAASA